MITKKIADNYEPDFERGEIILIDKPLRLSSFSIVYKVRKAVAVKKVGHAGTLDPMASGLMIVCTGRATKEITSMMGLNKTYTGIISLGKTTPSLDSETEFDSEKSIDDITGEKILETAGKFLGGSLQIPPMYSAVKHNGKALYKFARKGVEVERKPREIFISKFDILKIDLPDVHFEISCSSGTYIRVIADDLGKKLGCGAYLKNLRRNTIGGFDVDDAFDIKEFIAYSNKFVPVS
ncbi:MAG: tRNA pseudouridine(55) synthase TruB [Ignavibacteriales bacterium]|nr:tRNA pseudouridine(55) synthase TruB [Ignavibacteriales bacterium]